MEPGKNIYMTESKLSLKQDILNAAIQKQQTLINDFNHRLHEMSGGEKYINETQLDAQQASFNIELNEKMGGIATQKTFAEAEMNILNQLKNSLANQEQIHVGSVVITDQRNFFVAVSSEELLVNGVKYFGISAKAPIYATMAGKRTGESFQMNDLVYNIIETF
jgi:hypothetical protein